MSVRVRYAPSPTGYQHIGGARTALFNYFYARSQGGQFLLRVEDTDQERTFDLALEDLYATMKWLGVDWDEGPGKEGECGPYIQSERRELYTKYALQLVEQGKAYYCYCTSGRLERIRKIQEQNSLAPGYDRHCRDLSDAEKAEAQAVGAKPVIRLKAPLTGSITVHDELLGDITRDAKDVSPDAILLKSDGMPTYHLANVIDDHLMGITHVLRAQEWVPSAPLHKLLYEAFGWHMPKLCHLPMVMGNDGQKLSKRHGATSVREFVAKGYLPQAVTNYISLLGWSYDDSREFFSLDELCQFFSLERINKSPAVFDYKKLDWFNGQYIRKMSDDELFEAVLPFLQKETVQVNAASGEEIGRLPAVLSATLSEKESGLLKQLIPLIKERMQLLNEVSGLVRFIFTAPKQYNADDAVPKKMSTSETLAILQGLVPLVQEIDGHDDDANEQRLRNHADKLGLKINQVLQPLRVAVSGSKVSPPLFESMRLLGQQEVSDRVLRLCAIMEQGS